MVGHSTTGVLALRPTKNDVFQASPVGTSPTSPRVSWTKASRRETSSGTPTSSHHSISCLYNLLLSGFHQEINVTIIDGNDVDIFFWMGFKLFFPFIITLL